MQTSLDCHFCFWNKRVNETTVSDTNVQWPSVCRADGFYENCWIGWECDQIDEFIKEYLLHDWKFSNQTCLGKLSENPQKAGLCFTSLLWIWSHVSIRHNEVNENIDKGLTMQRGGFYFTYDQRGICRDKAPLVHSIHSKGKVSRSH